MDNGSHDQQQKDFLTSLFPPDLPVNHLSQGGDSQQQLMYNGSTAQAHMLGSNPAMDTTMQMNIELLGNLMSMQGIEGHQAVSQQQQQSYVPQPHLLLEQQFKVSQLQQLQQLQNRIFQQQLALITGQNGSSVPDTSQEPQREQQQQYHGLPTPDSSELRPQANTDYVSPMILQYMDSPQRVYHNNSMNTLTPQQSPQPFIHPHGSSSAPATMAFNNGSSLPLPSPLDFDMSPLTSPWLQPHQRPAAPRQSSNKRTASSSGDEMSGKPSRKKQSPAMRPTAPATAKKPIRGSKSASSTPLIRSSRSRRSSTAAEPVGDTPSPVDLSMPPPAPPSNQPSTSTSSMESSQTNPQLTPVTPASIMNLGRFVHPTPSDQAEVPSKNTAKGKAPARPKVSTEVGSRAKAPKKSPGTTLVSPSMKPVPIRPAGNVLPLPGPSAQHSPLDPGRKTSHKAAEQKRRDSLKTTFDDLRILLPPIPLPSDENFPDEPILPGALPPRGPPKAGGEGPNKGISKLQLLMCGNDYIRQLKGRVDRRDEEIGKLRREVARLRNLFGDDTMNTVGEELDLERDLDAVEAGGPGLGRGGSMIPGDDEADEE